MALYWQYPGGASKFYEIFVRFRMQTYLVNSERQRERIEHRKLYRLKENDGVVNLLDVDPFIGLLSGS